MMRTAVIGVATVLIAGCASSTSTSTAQPGSPGPVPSSISAPTTSSAASSAGPGRLVDVGNGRKMYLECSGTGGPTVVLVSGLGGRADDWQMTARPQDEKLAVYRQSARVTRVCAYDRPGT